MLIDQFKYLLSKLRLHLQESMMPLHLRITFALILGACLGLSAFFLQDQFPMIQHIGPWVAAPIGSLFLRLLFMMVIPLVSTALISSTAAMAQKKNVRKVAYKAFALALFLAFCAAVLSLIMVNTIQPGVNMQPRTLTLIEQQTTGTPPVPSTESTLDTKPWTMKMIEVVPKNPFEAFAIAHDPAKGGSIVSVIIFSILIGLTLACCPQDKVRPLLDLVASILELSRCYLSKLMQLAPIAVTALVFQSTQQFGPHLFSLLFWYMVAVLAGLAIQVLVVYAVTLKILHGSSIFTFLSKSRLISLTAFSTSSSSATLPVAIDVAQKNFRLEKDLSSFILTLGASMNQNGSALYEGITILFLAQLYQVKLVFSQQVIVLAMTMLASLGTAGVPGGTLPLMMSLCTLLGICPDGVLLILGVERLLDMSRTVVNSLGDLVIAVSLNPKKAPDCVEEKGKLPLTTTS